MKVINHAQQAAIHAKDSLKQNRINGENAHLQQMQPGLDAFHAYAKGVPNTPPIQGMEQGQMNPGQMPGQGGLLAMLMHGSAPQGMPPGAMQGMPPGMSQGVPGAGQPQMGPPQGMPPGQIGSMLPGHMPQGLLQFLANMRGNMPQR